MISIVTPIYGCKACLNDLVDRLHLLCNKLNVKHEIILVNDNSPDNAWETISEICQTNTKVKGINLSRNFGQHYAITAGLESAEGDWIVVMDCDLQDQPEEISKLYNKAKEGFDIVFAQRIIRQDGFFKKLSSKLFYRVFGYLTETKQDHSIANFGIYSRKAVDAVLSMKDQIRYFPTMMQWVGFNKTTVVVEHNSRENGESAYTWSSLLSLAFNNILSFSNKPLRLTINLGLVISAFSGLIGLFYLIKFIKGDIIVLGYASLIISIWFLSGVLIFVMGMVGLYVGKVFEKVKDRPVYIVKETKNFSTNI